MIKKLYGFLEQYKSMAWLCILLTAGEVVCELILPVLMSKIVDEGIPNQDMGSIIAIGVLMIGLAILAIILGVLNAKYSAQASQGFAANLRSGLYRKSQTFSFSNIDKFSSASLVTRMTSDVTILQTTLMMCLRILTRAPLMLICAFFVAATINFRLSLLIIGAVILLGIGTTLIITAAQKLFSEMQIRLDRLNGTVQENLVAIRVVKAFVREGHEKLKFEKVNDALMNAAVKAGSITSLMMPMMMLVLNCTTIGVIWFGGGFVGRGTMTTGELMSFISYIMQILMSIMMFSMIFVMVTRARACGERAVEVLDTAPEILDGAAEIPAPEGKQGKVEFRDVSFRYNGNGKSTEADDVLEHISFSVAPGELVGILGGTGSGKTSLVSLIPRFYDVSAGQVLVDDVDVKDYKQKELRNKIGMVMQKNNLFSGTIKENLLWGNQYASMEEVIAAAKDAQAHEFIESFPDGYDARLDQGGVNVSGGQKQRLCIARAMMKKPDILILDDSTSAVDTDTEARIRQSFNEHFSNTTVILVAQRISSVMDADKIIVLDNGGISAIGTHEELMQSNSIYQEIYHSQTEGSVA